MSHLKAQKIQEPKQSQSAAKLKTQEESMETLIRGINALVAHAENSDLGTAARILYAAREELVHWAVTMNFHETAQDRFINQRLYDNRRTTVEALVIHAIKKSGMCNEMLERLGLLDPKPLTLNARK